jgi:hypothetical protein
MTETRIYQRATEPRLRSLSVDLQPLVGSAPYRLYYDKAVFITADFGFTTDTAVQSVVDAAPNASPLLDAKEQVDAISLVERAAYLTLLDAINVERARHGAQAITKPQFIQAVKDRVETA